MMIIGPQTKHLLCIQNRPTCNTEATETVPRALNTPTLHYDVNISHPETRHPLDSGHVVIASTRQIDCIRFFFLELFLLSVRKPLTRYRNNRSMRILDIIVRFKKCTYAICFLSFFLLWHVNGEVACLRINR